MPSYLLSREAADDLRAIARYTIKTWGIEQAKTYESELKACLEKIGNGQAFPRRPIPGRSDLLHFRCNHHYIFYHLQPDRPPLILAILHERMSLVDRLRRRLEG